MMDEIINDRQQNIKTIIKSTSIDEEVIFHGINIIPRIPIIAPINEIIIKKISIELALRKLKHNKTSINLKAIK